MSVDKERLGFQGRAVSDVLQIDELRLWSNMTGVQIDFLARGDNLKLVQQQANKITLTQQQSRERMENMTEGIGENLPPPSSVLAGNIEQMWNHDSLTQLDNEIQDNAFTPFGNEQREALETLNSQGNPLSNMVAGPSNWTLGFDGKEVDNRCKEFSTVNSRKPFTEDDLKRANHMKNWCEAQVLVEKKQSGEKFTEEEGRKYQMLANVLGYTIRDGGASGLLGAGADAATGVFHISRNLAKKDYDSFFADGTHHIDAEMYKNLLGQCAGETASSFNWGPYRDNFDEGYKVLAREVREKCGI